MSALPHSTGRYRAYKKINGVEFQHYFSSQSKADTKQEELELLSKLAHKTRFRANGSMIGVSFKVERRAGRKKTISVCLNIDKNSRQLVFKDSFDKTWGRTIRGWSEMAQLHSRDIIEYREQLRVAKAYYFDKFQVLSTHIKNIDE